MHTGKAEFCRPNDDRSRRLDEPGSPLQSRPSYVMLKSKRGMSGDVLNGSISCRQLIPLGQGTTAAFSMPMHVNDIPATPRFRFNLEHKQWIVVLQRFPIRLTALVGNAIYELPA